jgi:SAM-dependent methyltransferase
MRKFHHFRYSEVARNVNFDLEILNRTGRDDLPVMLRLYYSLEFAMGQVLSDGDLNYHPNASFSVLKFISNLRLIRRRCGEGARFLDVGCGLGSKVWLAQSLGFDAYGLEINPKYVEVAKECVGTEHIICHDGLTYQDYDRFDVIYFYNPMPTDELESVILKTAKDGAIVYHAIDLQTPPCRNFSRLSPRIMQLKEARS